jgi:1,5-anhydro-D-fructose reductase (1,5-anhydro-D-mannitol-forming)
MTEPNGATGPRPLRWRIIGASQIARSWMADGIRAVPQCELVAVMSRDEARARDFANEFRLPHAVTRYEALFGLVDAVYVSTNNDRHAEASLAAAAAGVHVLCEKPLSLSIEDALAMARACDEAGVVMATNHHLRGAATLRAIRDLVQTGRIGKPLAARAMYCEYLPEALQTWRTNDPKQGGVIYDLTVHNVDALRFVLADDPVEVTSMMASSLIGRNGVEDQVSRSSGSDPDCSPSCTKARRLRIMRRPWKFMGRKARSTAAPSWTKPPLAPSICGGARS